MQLFIAYKFFKHIDKNDLRARQARVEKYYFSNIDDTKIQRYESTLANIGLLYWNTVVDRYKFPSWGENEQFASCFTYAPNGWEQVVDNGVTMSNAPLCFTNEIKQNPRAMNLMTPPLIFTYLDKQENEIKIYNDCLGMGKLYELHLNEGVVYSNKLGALYIYSNEKAEMDRTSWKIFSNVGWFMGDSCPIKGARRVKPGIEITLKNEMHIPKYFIHLGGLQSLVSPRELDAVSFDSEMSNILASAKSFFRMFDFPVNSMLSGGKDSRVSSAILVKAEIDCTFKTLGPLTGEIETAKKLIELIGLDNKHTVDEPTSQHPIQITVHLEDRLRLLHFAYDADFTPVKQTGMVSSGQFYKISGVFSVGAGGEIASGNYYSNDNVYKSIIEKGEEGPFWRLSSYLSSLTGTNQEAFPIVERELWLVFEEAKQFGLKGMEIMDYFYLKERLRRWAPISGVMNSFTPFSTPGFIRLSFDLTPEQRKAYTLHKMMLKHLIPEWADVPFYKSDIRKENRDQKAENNMRIWQNEDRYYVDMALNERTIWKDYFNESETMELWNKAMNGESIYRKFEALFQRIVWLTSFEEHINRINVASGNDV